MRWFEKRFDPVYEESGDAAAGWDAVAANETKLPTGAKRRVRQETRYAWIYSWYTVIVLVALGALCWAGRFFLMEVAPDIAAILLWPGFFFPLLAAGVLAGVITD